jgi:hypothetical protein
LCNLWTSWRIHHQFASRCICDAEIGVSCKEELLESWWWCDFLSVPVLSPRSSLHIPGLYGGKNYPALWNFHCGHFRETKLCRNDDTRRRRLQGVRETHALVLPEPWTLALARELACLLHCEVLLS